jgi:branched-chain amino acid transport system ATP-binding protein
VSDILAVEGITLRYGRLTAVNAVDLRIPAGARHALIGPNGAGKSSLFSVLAGAVRQTSGVVRFDGEDISSVGEIQRARAGLVRTYQHSNLFLGLSVLDNVLVAVERRRGHPLRPWSGRRRARAMRVAAEEYVDRVGLGARVSVPASALSHGERRQLEVAVVLACEPRVVLFDEPTAGMSAAETLRFSELVESLPAEIATVIVEHDLDVVFRLADRISVLAAGTLIADGTPEEIRADPAVAAAYLGADRSDDPLFGEQS